MSSLMVFVNILDLSIEQRVFCVYCSLLLFHIIAGARLEQRAVSVQTNSALSCFPFPLHCPLVGRLTRHWQAKRQNQARYYHKCILGILQPSTTIVDFNYYTFSNKPFFQKQFAPGLDSVNALIWFFVCFWEQLFSKNMRTAPIMQCL